MAQQIQGGESSKFAESLRGLGALLIALTLPFVILSSLIASVVAPEYMRKRSAARRAYLDQIREWQSQQLSSLRAKSFSELSVLPPRTDLPSPPPFARERFAILRSAGDNGGVEVGVAHFMRHMGIFLGRITPSFEMLSDGSLIEPNYEPDD
jgi:hypothetical protein